jgi:methylglutaconyl-CoA hydratase
MDLDYLKRFIQLGHSENLDDAVHLMKLLQTIHTLKKPVIAKVAGPAMGGGCGIAAACDFVFAGKEGARFGVPEVRLGFLPALILLFLLKRMGEGRTREFALRGETLGAGEAFARGLATEVVDDALLDERVAAFALELATSTSQSSITLTKELLSRLGELSEKEALEYAANLNAVARKTEDFRKGIESFVKKEKLRW